jgi:hypothetical protein
MARRAMAPPAGLRAAQTNLPGTTPVSIHGCLTCIWAGLRIGVCSCAGGRAVPCTGAGRCLARQQPAWAGLIGGRPPRRCIVAASCAGLASVGGRPDRRQLLLGTGCWRARARLAGGRAALRQAGAGFGLVQARRLAVLAAAAALRGGAPTRRIAVTDGGPGSRCPGLLGRARSEQGWACEASRRAPLVRILFFAAVCRVAVTAGSFVGIRCVCIVCYP